MDDISTMIRSLPALIKKNPRSFGLFVALPFVLACVVLALAAAASLLHSPTPLGQTNPVAPDPDAPASKSSSTLQGEVFGDNGLSIQEVGTEGFEGSFEARAIQQEENEVLVVVGGSGSCPTNFTDIYEDEAGINLEAQAGVGIEKACTDDYHLQGFLIKSYVAVEADAVNVNFISGNQSFSLPIERAELEEEPVAQESLESNGYSLRELSKDESADAAKILEELQLEAPAAIKSADSTRALFTVAGSSTCPIEFVTIEPSEANVALGYSGGDAKRPCTKDLQPRYFELQSADGIVANELRVQSAEDPTQETVIKFTERPSV